VEEIKFHTNCSNKNYLYDFVEFAKFAAFRTWSELLTAFCEINRIANDDFHSKMNVSGSYLANGQIAE